jgi:hypothetical protein
MNPTRLLTSTFTNVLDSSGTLKSLARDPQGLNASGLSRVARVVAFVMAILVFMPLQAADGIEQRSITAKDYIRFNYDSKEASCLIRLYGKESAFNPKAIGNLSSPSKSYVYGIPQLKNPIIKDLSAIKQIDYGMKYINHRYDGKPCLAWEHWKKKGWH